MPTSVRIVYKRKPIKRRLILPPPFNSWFWLNKPGQGPRFPFPGRGRFRRIHLPRHGWVTVRY